MKIVGRRFFVAQTSGHNPEIVVDLGKRKAHGDEIEGRLGARKIAQVVSRESQIKVGFAGQRVRSGNLREGGDGLVVLTVVEIRAPKVE